MNGKVYKITNNITNEAYIGKTTNTVDNRLKQHIKGTDKEKRERSLLQQAMVKYGYDNFTIELLQEGIDSDFRLNEIETGYMMIYGTLREYNAMRSITEENAREGSQITADTNCGDDDSMPSQLAINKNFADFDFSQLDSFEIDFTLYLMAIMQKTKSCEFTIDIYELKQKWSEFTSKVECPSRVKSNVDKLIKKSNILTINDVGIPFIESAVLDGYELKIKLNNKYIDYFVFHGREKTNTISLDKMLVCDYVYMKRIVLLSITYKQRQHFVIASDEFRNKIGAPSNWRNAYLNGRLVHNRNDDVLKVFKTYEINVIYRGRKTHSYEVIYSN